MNATCAARHDEGETCGNCCDHGNAVYMCAACAATNALVAGLAEVEKVRDKEKDRAWYVANACANVIRDLIAARAQVQPL